MIVDFTSIPETTTPHMRGGEKEAHFRTFQDDLTRIARGRLVPGASIGLHAHETNCEVVYVLSGSGKYICDGVEEPLSPGVCHYCPKGHAHTLINDGDTDLEFLAVIPEQP